MLLGGGLATQGISSGHFLGCQATTFCPSFSLRRTEKTRPARCYLKAQTGGKFLASINSTLKTFRWVELWPGYTRFIGYSCCQKTIPSQWIFWKRWAKWSVKQAQADSSSQIHEQNNNIFKHVSICFFSKTIRAHFEKKGHVPFRIWWISEFTFFLKYLSRRWRRCSVLPKSQAVGLFNLPDEGCSNHLAGVLKTNK